MKARNFSHASMVAASRGFINARRVALKALLRVEHEGSFSNLVLHGLIAKEIARAEAAGKSDSVKSEDIRLANELLYGTLRKRLLLDQWIRQLSARKTVKVDPPVLNILRLSLYQLIFLDRIPQHAVLDEAGKLARSVDRTHAVGFINAVLRKYLRLWRDDVHEPELPRDALERLAVEHSTPRWILERWAAEIEASGVDDRRILLTQLKARAEAVNRIPPLTVCINRSRHNLVEFFRIAQEAGADPRPGDYAPDAVSFEAGDFSAVRSLMENGDCHAMDEAAQLVGVLLDPQPGMRVLDMCAAPGGKSLQAAALMNNSGEVFSLDIHGARLELLATQSQLCGLDIIRTLEADSMKALPGLEEASFDRVLIDAPCSALGIIRRHPEIRYRRGPQDIAERAVIARAILDNARRYVKPGGVLVFAVCTYTREETLDQLEYFSQFKDFEIVKSAEVNRGLWKEHLGLPYMDTRPAVELDGFAAFKAVRRSI